MTSFCDIWQKARADLERDERRKEQREARVKEMLAQLNAKGLPITRCELQDIIEAGCDNDETQRSEIVALEILIGVASRQ